MNFNAMEDAGKSVENKGRNSLRVGSISIDMQSPTHSLPCSKDTAE